MLDIVSVCKGQAPLEADSSQQGVSMGVSDKDQSSASDQNMSPTSEAAAMTY